jgi:hypothetical protein
MTDSAANYLVACAAIRLLHLLTAVRWAEPEDTFDLIIAAALMRRGRA